mmetsp:Transcript_36696/g.32901  ORF Transcript_36696/g.32901 Transcript_36696/m.32901 type:complete len:88 (+) Transcript_36696:66-329(+)
MSRGWDPNPKKDSLITETDLDDFMSWTARFDNSDNSEKGKILIKDWIEWTVIPRIEEPQQTSKEESENFQSKAFLDQAFKIQEKHSH